MYILVLIGFAVYVCSVVRGYVPAGFTFSQPSLNLILNIFSHLRPFPPKVMFFFPFWVLDLILLVFDCLSIRLCPVGFHLSIYFLFIFHLLSHSFVSNAYRLTVVRTYLTCAMGSKVCCSFLPMGRHVCMYDLSPTLSFWDALQPLAVSTTLQFGNHDSFIPPTPRPNAAWSFRTYLHACIHPQRDKIH